LGRQFSHELINAVAAMPQRQLDDALAQLVRAELIFRRGTPPNAEYTFKHALVQDAAYSTLLRSRRQQLHARIADTSRASFRRSRLSSLHWSPTITRKQGLPRRRSSIGSPQGDRRGDDRCFQRQCRCSATLWR